MQRIAPEEIREGVHATHQLRTSGVNAIKARPVVVIFSDKRRQIARVRYEDGSNREATVPFRELGPASELVAAEHEETQLRLVQPAPAIGTSLADKLKDVAPAAATPPVAAPVDLGKGERPPVGVRLEVLRKLRGMTRQTAAKLAGVGSSSIHVVELQTLNPREPTLRLLARIYQVPFELTDPSVPLPVELPEWKGAKPVNATPGGKPKAKAATAGTANPPARGTLVQPGTASPSAAFDAWLEHSLNAHGALEKERDELAAKVARLEAELAELRPRLAARTVQLKQLEKVLG